MNDIARTISDFKSDIIFHTVVSAFFIVLLAVLLCIIKKKFPAKDSRFDKARWIVILFLVFACFDVLKYIPSYVDVYTDNIKAVEITDYISHYHDQKFGLNPGGTSITFHTADGDKLRGYMAEDFDIPDSGHGYILYARCSRYILDCDLSDETADADDALN